MIKESFTAAMGAEGDSGGSREMKDRSGVLEGRPPVLVVAGYDQSAGAGVLSDIKTLEMNGVYGMQYVRGSRFRTSG